MTKDVTSLVWLLMKWSLKSAKFQLLLRVDLASFRSWLSLMCFNPNKFNLTDSSQQLIFLFTYSGEYEALAGSLWKLSGIAPVLGNHKKEKFV